MLNKDKKKKNKMLDMPRMPRLSEEKAGSPSSGAEGWNQLHEDFNDL